MQKGNGWYFMDAREFRMLIRKLRNTWGAFEPSARKHSREFRKYHRLNKDWPF